VAFVRGEQSRAIALHTRSLKHAERAHDSRTIGLAHYELALCYKQVGDSGIVRDHLTEAASALHAAGDRRHLALVHRLSAVLLAQSGRSSEATGALRQGERLAQAVQANDVVAGIVHNQANVALMRHQYDEALALSERSVALHETLGSGHGLAVALATLGQILVQLGDLERAEQILTRTLDVRSSVQFKETTGAVFDTLAQIHLMRGSYERAGDYLRQASEAYGAHGTQTMRWYEWSLKVLGVKLAIRRGAYDEAVTQAEALVQTAGVPPAEALQAELAACEALVAANRIADAERRLEMCEGQLDPRAAPGSWGEFLRIRGAVHESSDRPAAAHHDFAQSASVFDLLGERYHAAVSNVALGRIAAKAGRQQAAQRYLDNAAPSLAYSALTATSRTWERYGRWPMVLRGFKPLTRLPTPTKRSFGAWSTRRFCRNFSHGRLRPPSLIPSTSTQSSCSSPPLARKRASSPRLAAMLRWRAHSAVRRCTVAASTERGSY
jgi:tetratricopeptide (TPR) repeat protein